MAHVGTQGFTEDYDGMAARKTIRALVPYSKTFYFLDMATAIRARLSSGLTEKPNLYLVSCSQFVRISRVIYCSFPADSVLSLLADIVT